MRDMTFVHRLPARAVPFALVLAVLAPPIPAVAATRAAVARGVRTTWAISLLRIRDLDRLPHYDWAGYRRHYYRFYVMTVQMANTGRRAADPYDDLTLTLKVLPGYPARHPTGFQSILHGRTNVEYHAAVQAYGGTLPWVTTLPGHTTTYCYVIVTPGHDYHYGLYNWTQTKGYIYLLNTGV